MSPESPPITMVSPFNVIEPCACRPFANVPIFRQELFLNSAMTSTPSSEFNSYWPPMIKAASEVDAVEYLEI